MSESPLISVIVPVYNTETYLRKCLDSICGQSYHNLEILCVNDGSTDSSAAILEEYAAKDPRIKVITQKNAGLSAARNIGLDYASGEWITGVDSDDYLAPDTYEYALNEVTESTDIICYGTQVMWQEQTINLKTELYFNWQYTGTLTPTLDTINLTPCTFWDKLWRKSFIQHYNCRFPEGLWYEDTHFYYGLAPFARQISYRPSKKYHYVQRGGSIMSLSKLGHDKLFDRLRIAQTILDYYKQHPLPAHMQSLRLFVFKNQFLNGLECLDSCSIKKYITMAHHIAHQYGLLKQYSAQLRFLNQIPWYLKPFVKHTFAKSYYGLPGLRLLTINRKEDEEVFRFFGCKYRKKYNL